jgi:hypothetical protein
MRLPDVANPQRVLVAPLDWGLGHATRCVPVIRALLARGSHVQIASSAHALVLLQKEFPPLTTHELVSYRARYSTRWPLMIQVLLLVPKFLAAIRYEHRQVRAIASREQITHIISDQRFGAWVPGARNVFITHQLQIQMPPWLKPAQPIVNFFNHQWIKKFQMVWVPDDPAVRLAGKLCHSRLKFTWVGLLSRFAHVRGEKSLDVLILLSGPEPQRTVLENNLRSQLTDFRGSHKIVRGLPALPNTATECNHLTATELQTEVARARVVICRSGYSSLMDFVAMKAHAILIPTPGQTEQEYLAAHWKRHGRFYSETQRTFRLLRALERASQYAGFADTKPTTNLLAQAIDSLLA